MPRILVACYSRTGRTRQLADAIADGCGADLEVIRDVRDRSGLLGYFRSGREAVGCHGADIRNPEKDSRDYDLVVLGTPVWAGNMSSPMRTYIRQQGMRLKRLALFCTEGSGGGERALQEMARLCGIDPVAGLIVTGGELKTGAFEPRLESFVRALQCPPAVPEDPVEAPAAGAVMPAGRT